MGTPKLFLPWGAGTVISHLVETWQSLGASQIVLVANRENEPHFRAEVPSAEIIVNTNPELGMFSSIRSAAQWSGWNPALSHYVIALGDQPHLPLSSLRPVIELARANPSVICQPAFKGRPRHPVILPRGKFEELALPQAGTLKEFLSKLTEAVKKIEVEDPALDLDIDTPADYGAALELWKSRSGED